MQSTTTPPSQISFHSGDREVRLDVFLSPGGSMQPALLLLHGASGLGGGNEYIPRLASALAEQGFGTVVVRYFDATGTTYATDATIWKNFECWLETIRGAVDYVSGLREVDAGKVALVGYSLGGFLAVAHAARDPRIRAVVEVAGGIDPSHAEEVKRLPPTFIAHGKKDGRVPVERAHGLRKVLEQLGAPHEERIYPDEGHFLSAGAALDAFSGAVSFLQQHLQIRE